MKWRVKAKVAWLTITTALLLASCGGPKVVPDAELAQIFHDVYLVNSYASQRIVPGLDSLNLYEPIFARYGYTSEDIQYTIGSFAKRKSARLSDDVVEPALAMLRSESRAYAKRLAVRDTMISIAKKRFATTIHHDSLIRVRRTADTARLRFVLEDIRPGSYHVSYDYHIDSTDTNPMMRTEMYMVDSLGRHIGDVVRFLNRDVPGHLEGDFTTRGHERRLVVSINGYRNRMTTPNLTVTDFRVTHYLPAAIAYDSLNRSRFRIPRLDSLFN
ncbi:MAG: DUF4296 domain-containing protein [Alistipes sp.]|jgi:hypothetical protein|nr:DUF4296 domain-containing protein [Alistipes sp.]